MADGARLEIVCAVAPYRGFESLPLRQFSKRRGAGVVERGGLENR